ncbi:MAG: hypothetical protein PHQ57_00060 [Candidatus Omnitrophica bacterium]|nr:hypothetical protein [Candidatus Omnitrophota bacterium]
MSNLQGVLLEPARVLLTQISQFFVSVLLVLIIILIGWLVSKLIKTVVTRILVAVKIDDFADRVELAGILSKGGIKYSLSELIGVICYWLALLVTFVVALGTVNLITSTLLDRIVSYIPNIIAAIFVLILGIFVAALLKNIVQTAASNAGLNQAKFLGRIAEVVVVVFAVLIAMEELNIGAKIIELTVGIALGSLGLAFAIAFGLGSRDFAEKTISELAEKLKKK